MGGIPSGEAIWAPERFDFSPLKASETIQTAAPWFCGDDHAGIKRVSGCLQLPFSPSNESLIPAMRPSLKLGPPTKSVFWETTNRNCRKCRFA